MPSEALGLLECKGLVSLMEGTDAMLKSANVEMIGWDKAGSGMVTAFVRGDVAAVKAAVDAGAESAGRVGTVISVHVIARPHDELPAMFPKARKAAAPVGGAFVTTIVRGDVGSVRAAVDAGSEAAGRVGELIAAHIIARPHPELLAGFGAGGSGGS